MTAAMVAYDGASTKIHFTTTALLAPAATRMGPTTKHINNPAKLFRCNHDTMHFLFHLLFDDGVLADAGRGEGRLLHLTTNTLEYAVHLLAA